MALFNSRDVRNAFALIDGAYASTGPEPFAENVVELLARLIPGEIVGYSECELISRRFLTSREMPSVNVPEVATAVRTFCAQYPLSMLRRSAEIRALKISDFMSSNELHRLDYYDHGLRPLGIEHQIRLWLAAPPGIARYLYVSRGRVDADFSERDRELLELLRPSLAALRGRFDAQLSYAQSGTGLTERETEILAWVARGKTNQEIANLLVLSPHTVRKHLERTYEKLRVHTRTAAVARGLRPVEPAAASSGRSS